MEQKIKDAITNLNALKEEITDNDSAIECIEMAVTALEEIEWPAAETETD